MLGHHHRLAALGCVGLLMIAMAPVTTAATASEEVGLGMNTQSAKALREAGAPPQYSSYWVGPWTLQYGWHSLDNMLRDAKAQGTTPVIYWYYWGDSISPSCVDDGCNGRTREQWSYGTRTLADHVRTHMGGTRAIVVVENEFNKNGIDSTSYAPVFDRHLKTQIDTLSAVEGLEVVLGYGAWMEQNWDRFPLAIAASDTIGFQMMRASTRDTEANYRGAPDKIASTLAHSVRLGKPTFLYDLALSSYPDAKWARIQADTIRGIIDRSAEYAAMGLEGIVYRELNDNPSMDPANYFGEAEKHWGLRDAAGNPKPAFEHWLAAYGQVLQAPEPNVPATFEGESIPATTGRAENDARASGGKVWNLWANGELRQVLVAPAGNYTVTALARGASAGGVDARMEIRLNGHTLSGFSVPSGTLRPYSVNVRLTEGTSILAIAFTNDAVVNSQDRNLYVDLVRVDANRVPAPSFTASVSDLSVVVDASGSTDADGHALTYAWDFGDGTTATGVTATKTYPTAGEYPITLTVRDWTSAANATQRVGVTAPVLTAFFNATGDHLDWSFDATASADPGGGPMTYAWDFGDGTGARGALVNRTYAKGGNYSVTLLVSNATTTAVTGRVVTAVTPNVPPVAAFNVTGLNLTWTLDASGSYDPDGGAMAYAWDFGDGTTATGLAVTKTYARAGEYAVSLTVRDDKNASAASRTVAAVAPNLPPTASFALSGGGQLLTFDASGSADPEGHELRYEWSFGDGGPVVLGKRVVKDYARQGAYTVTLTVVDHLGLIARSVQTVQATPFAAQFTPHDGGNWWVQARVSGNEPVQSVCASVNGGECRPLKLQSWGSWATSFNVPSGSKLTFTATSTSGRQATSVAYEWPSGMPYLTATFRPHGGNAWWVQANVDASQPLKSVCASVNGGACRPLALQSWGSWAASMPAPSGSQVTFIATSTSNQVVTSSSYKWPVS